MENDTQRRNPLSALRAVRDIEIGIKDVGNRYVET